MRRSIPVAMAVAALVAAPGVQAQLSYSTGQTISPAYEGYWVNEDGSYELMFGYMNKNWLEEPDVPVGPDNYFAFTSPGGLDDLEVDAYDPEVADQGQPSHFLPRRNRFTFKVHMPADWPDQNQELVWTLTTQGETKRAFATLRQDLLVDNMVIASETGSLGAGASSPETRANTAPMIEIETDPVIEARVGQPVRLVARVTDDGLPASAALRRRLQRQRQQAAALDSAAAADSARTEEAAADTPAADGAPAARGQGRGGRGGGRGGGAGRGRGGAGAGDQAAEEELTPELQALQRAFNEPGRVTVNKVDGLFFAWFIYRGEGSADFTPIQVKTWEDSRAWMNSPWSPNWVAPPVPDDDRWIVDVVFDEPGTYVLRGRADDGALYADKEVTVNVTPLVN